MAVNNLQFKVALRENKNRKSAGYGKVEDGILTITMPKTEPKEKVTKAIEVS